MDQDTPHVVSAPPLQTQEHVLSQGYGIMPNMVLFDDQLSSGAKLLYCYLNSLSAATGECYPKNKHLSEKFGVSTRQVSSLLKELLDATYVLATYSDPDTMTGKRTLLLYERGGWKKTSMVVEENFYSNRSSATGITETINNTNNITNKLSEETLSHIDKLYTLYLIRMRLDPHQLAIAPTDTDRKALLDAAKKNYRLTDKRRNKIITRLKDCGYEMCAKAVNNIGKSDFHKGENDRKWVAQLEWLFNSVEKIEEWANKEDQ